MNLNSTGNIFRGSLCPLFIFFILAIISAPGAYAAGPVTTAMTVGPAVEMVPARLPRISVSPRSGVEVPLGYAVDRSTLKALKTSPAPALKGGVQPAIRRDPSAKAAAPLAPGLVTGFEGVDNGGQPDGFLHRPPDPIMAAGPNHVVTVVNSTLDIYDKTGTPLMETSLASWFSSLTPPGGPFDPKIVYDAQTGHWLLIALASDFSSQAVYLLSVSQTNDPTGPWWNYSISSVSALGGSAWGDYEDIGFDGNPTGSVYISSNQFSFAGGVFTTAQVLAISKTELYAGASLTVFRTVGLKNSDGSMAFTIRVARSLGSTGTEYMINSHSGGGNSVTLWNATHAFPAAPVITRQATVNIGGYGPPPNARQKGCADTLDTIDNRIYNAVYKNGKLYAAFTESHNWGSGAVAAIRFLEINTSTNAPLVNETYGQDGFYYWFPAVTVDGSGNIVSVFARSGSGEFAGIRYSGRLTTDTATEPSLLLKAGQSCITGSRWGDYFGASVDPVDSAKVWVFGEWAKDVPGVSPVWDWGTWVGEVSFAVPPAITLTLTPDTASVARGGTLGYQINAMNNTASTLCFDYWEDVRLPGGGVYPPSGELFGPVHLCMAGGSTKSVHMTRGVPPTAPLGTYGYNGHIGVSYPTVYNTGGCNFDVTAFGPVTGKPATSWSVMKNGFRR